MDVLTPTHVLLFTQWLILGGSLVGLLGGAELLVRGASALAKRFNVPSFVVGLTVVAYGTSLPELAVSVTAALNGSPGLALGNAIGSNIANLGLVLGLAVLTTRTPPAARVPRGEITLLLTTTLLLPIVLADGRIDALDGALFLTLSILITRWFFRRGERIISELHAHHTPFKYTVIFLLLGFGLLVLCGQWFVTSASSIALVLGVSERIVGLTIVAIGTSLPELITSLIAFRKREGGIAIGNLLGSNIFNVCFILGATAIVSPLHATLSTLWFDLIVLVGIVLLASALLSLHRPLRRLEGALLLTLYIGYIVAITL